MLGFIPHNLRRLGDFSGRQRRAMFWPYVGVFYLVTTFASVLAIVPQIFDMVARVQQFAADNPDQVTEVRTATSYSITVNEFHPELMPDFGQFVAAIAAVMTVFVALIAAAVARRLHDRDRSGWWGLLPLPFLFGGFFGMHAVFTGFTGGAPDIVPFLWLFLNNLIYLATLIYLVVVLAQAGTPGTNRFGDDPKLNRIDDVSPS